MSEPEVPVDEKKTFGGLLREASPNSKYFDASKRKVHVQGTNLFGEDFRPDSDSILKQRFEFTPFSIFNQREGPWQARKAAWLALGIQSEVGRGENLLKMSDTVLEPDPEKRAAMRGYAKTFDSGGPGSLAKEFKARAFNDHDWQREKLGKVQAKKIESASLDRQHGIGMTTDPYRKEGEEVEGAGSTGTSIFDPVLCELSYKWFCPPGGLILDPFAGGSVRGLVAGILGYRYYGIELRAEQVEANYHQKERIAPDADITWVCGDSNVVLPEAPMADMVFSCPPYFDLEVYSDDKNDLSAMSWEQFVGVYRSIIRKAVERLKPNRFASFVISEIRDKKTGLYRGFVPLTAASFMAVGADLYNEAILVNSVGSLAIRIDKQFRVSRKLGRTHQNVLIHVKGDPRIAAAACAGEPVPAAAVALLPPPVPARNSPAPAAGPPATLSLPPLPAPIARPAPTPPPAADTGLAEPDRPFPALPRIEGPVATGSTSLAEFLQSTPPQTNYTPPEPLDLSGIDEIILNFETNGLEWSKGHRPIGVTIGTLDGRVQRYLPFAHQGGGNLDESAVKRYVQEQVRGKRITNIRTSFDVHMAREWGIDLEEQGNSVSDIAHYAALLDDHRKRFALDVLAKDYLGAVDVMRVDERNMASYAAWDVAQRAEYQAKLVAQLREKMWPELDAQELQKVRQLEDDVIYPVVEMEKNGAQMDIELLEQMFKQCTAEHERLMSEVVREAGFPFEVSASGWQRLFEKCGLPPQDSYAEDIVSSFDHPLLAKAQRAAQFASLNSKTFAAYRKNIDAEGVLRFDINQLRGDDGGTVSGRFSIGYVQQVPNHDNHHEAFGIGENAECVQALCNLFPRRVYVPRAGRALGADAAQIEYRIFAHFAGNKKVLDAYAADPHMSFHKFTWAMFKEFKPDMKYSHMKNTNFMKMYGGGLAKLAFMMGFISKQEFQAFQQEENNPRKWDDPKLAEAKKIQQIYENVMPEVSGLIARASHLAKSGCDQDCERGLKGRHRETYRALHDQYPHRGYVRTLEGRRSRFPNNWKTYRGLNRVIQGTGADINKRKLVELHKQRKDTGFLMRLTVHDEIFGDAPDQACEDKVRAILNTQSYPEIRVPIMWEVRSGQSWAECK